MNKPLWIWIVFFSVVGTLLLLDLGVFHKKYQEIKPKESIWTSFFYIIVSLIFCGWIWYQLGAQSAKDYLTGFIVEKSLAVDNLFVISVIFQFFSIPSKYQHRVLFWGIIGAIVFRAIIIGLGAKLIIHLTWVFYLFGVLLIFTGVKMFFIKDQKFDLSNNILLKFLNKYLCVTKDFHDYKFFIIKENKAWCTPLFLSLILIEFVDLIFAIDSVPAIFSITTDPYIVYTSNIFAILGLRSLYFALSGVIQKMVYLKYALAMILIFIGSKVFITDLLNLEKFPAGVSLGVTCGLLALGIVFSIYKKKIF